MTLDDKRKLIEVLLCAGDTPGPGVGAIVAHLHAVRLFDDAVEQRTRVEAELVEADGCEHERHYDDSCHEAAYRLIESAPTLRREWFGSAISTMRRR